MSDYLPRDLLIEILLRLPVKSLLRFTVVCKSWYSLITSPEFTSLHLSSHSNNKNQQILLRRYTKVDMREHYTLHKDDESEPFNLKFSPEFDFPFKSKIGYFRVVGSCKGLLCLSDDLFSDSPQPIILWNPSIQKHINLPPPLIKPNAPQVVVLGFGSHGDVLKVVRIVYVKNADLVTCIIPAEVEIYSTQTRIWEKLTTVDVRYPMLDFVWNPAFVNGAVHWIAYNPSGKDGFFSLILSFHMGDEVFSEIRLPDELARESPRDLSITVIGESLAVVKYYNQAAGAKSFCIWVMKEYGVRESWTRLYITDVLEGLERVVGARENGEALLAMESKKLVAYNRESSLIKDLKICATTRSFHMDNYMESLVLLGVRKQKYS